MVDCTVCEHTVAVPNHSWYTIHALDDEKYMHIAKFPLDRSLKSGVRIVFVFRWLGMKLAFLLCDPDDDLGRRYTQTINEEDVARLSEDGKNTLPYWRKMLQVQKIHRQPPPLPPQEVAPQEIMPPQPPPPSRREATPPQPPPPSRREVQVPSIPIPGRREVDVKPSFLRVLRTQFNFCVP